MFEIAKSISVHSEHHKFQLGAVITKGNRIVSTGWNKLKTSPRSKHPYKTLHAEMSAILSARTDLRGTDIYIYRETKDGKLASSKPCEYCLTMIQEAGIKNIYFTNSEGDYDRI